MSIYERQEDWDNVVECYQALQQLEKAEDLIRRQMSKDEKNPKYCCILGDITQCVEYYEKAIKVIFEVIFGTVHYTLLLPSQQTFIGRNDASLSGALYF